MASPTTQQTLKRTVGTKAFVDSQEVSIDIPRVQDINSVMVVVRGSMTIGAASATGLAGDSPAGLIQRFDFVANGKDVLAQCSGAKASIGNYQRSFANQNVDPGLTVGTHPVVAVYRLDRDMMDGIRPKDSSFQAYMTNLLSLNMITGDANTDEATNCLVSPDSSTTVSFTGNIDVVVESTQELAGGRGEPKFIRKETRQIQSVTGSNTSLTFRMPTGNLMRSLTVRCLDDGIPTDALISNLEFAVDGVDVRYKGNFFDAKRQNADDKNISMSSVPTGYAVIDFCRANRAGVKLSQAVNLQNVSECKLSLDNNAPEGTTGVIEITIEEYIVPRA